MKIKTKFVSIHTADSKPVKQEVNSTMILPPLVFPSTNTLAYFAEALIAKEKKSFMALAAGHWG